MEVYENMSKKESHLIRIDADIKQQLDRLRELASEGTFSYNDIVRELLNLSGKYKRQRIVRSWVQYGTKQQLDILIKMLSELEQYDMAIEHGSEFREL